MAKADRRLERWLENPPVEVPVHEVLAMLERFFPGSYEMKGGSHIVVRDDRLIGLHGYGPRGDFQIPVKGGQKVKGAYLKRLARAAKDVEED